MGIRKRALAIVATTVLGVGLASGVAAADYWQFQGHYPTEPECVAAAQPYLWPTNPGGADDYACQAKDGGWDLYLIFAT
jgi:hypothetical protein